MDKTCSTGSPDADSHTPEIVDLRGLEAPEPMVRILTACANLEHGNCFKARLPHIPSPLFPHLESRGLSWEIEELPDDSVIIEIRTSI